MHCICCLSDNLKYQPLGFEYFFSCQNCGLLFQLQDKKSSTKSSIVRHYQNDDPHTRVAASKSFFFKYVMNYLSTSVDKKNWTILDIGCGSGYFLELANKCGWKVYGAELVNTLVNGAKQRLETDNVFHDKLKEAHYAADFFGAITFWDVLLMADDPSRELEECFRILKNGGILGIRVRNVPFQKFAYYAYLPFKTIGQQLGIKYPSVFHPYCFNSKSMDTLLSRLGFINIQITNSPLTNGDPYDHVSMLGLIKILKHLMNLFSRAIFTLSRKKWIIGPSLLIWAEKPEKEDTLR
jgi:SAM-dependent methyltransferase